MATSTLSIHKQDQFEFPIPGVSNNPALDKNSVAIEAIRAQRDSNEPSSYDGISPRVSVISGSSMPELNSDYSSSDEDRSAKNSPIASRENSRDKRSESLAAKALSAKDVFQRLKNNKKILKDKNLSEENLLKYLNDNKIISQNEFTSIADLLKYLKEIRMVEKYYSSEESDKRRKRTKISALIPLRFITAATVGLVTSPIIYLLSDRIKDREKSYKKDGKYKITQIVLSALIRNATFQGFHRSLLQRHYLTSKAIPLLRSSKKVELESLEGRLIEKILKEQDKEIRKEIRRENSENNKKLNRTPLSVIELLNKADFSYIPYHKTPLTELLKGFIPFSEWIEEHRNSN